MAKKLKDEKVNTVNVIEVSDNSVFSVRSFNDNDQGNKQAEDIFGKLAEENGADPVDMDDHLDDGFFEFGTYTVYITHSV